MTRDEHRAKCIVAIKIAHRMVVENPSFSIDEYEDIAATAAFDALHGIARVVPIEATEEMIMHAALQSNTTWAYIFRVMAARGGLTNPLEKNP